MSKEIITAQRQFATERYILSTMPTVHLPLWKRDGSTILMDDGSGIACTVTEALWTKNGRNFDGTNDQIDCGSPSTIPIGNTRRTYEVWVKPNSPLAATNYFAIGTGPVGNNNSFLLGITTTPNFYAVITTAGAGNNLQGTTTITNWNHLLATYDGAGIMELFVNGVTVGTKNITSTNTATSRTIIGGYWDGAAFGEFWKGWIGEVRIYNRLLSAIAIRQNYEMTKWRYQ